MDLRGKVALITGATGAIGAASARALAEAGATVVLVSRSVERLTTLVGELGTHAHVIEGNVARQGEAERIVYQAIAAQKRLDILVNAVNLNAAADALGARMIEQLAQAQYVEEQDVRAFLVQSTPLRRLVTPDEVAAAVLFYASAQSGFITGTSLTLDGGAHRAIA